MPGLVGRGTDLKGNPKTSSVKTIGIKYGYKSFEAGLNAGPLKLKVSGPQAEAGVSISDEGAKIGVGGSLLKGEGCFKLCTPGESIRVCGEVCGAVGATAPGLFLALNTRSQYTAVTGDPALMYAYPCTNRAGVLTGCTIHINPGTLDGRTPAMLRTLLIHETMHCFTFDRFAVDLPAWYMEGAATWVMSVLGSAEDRLSKAWLRYLDRPQRPLGRRDYDAVGFFAHLAETGTDVSRRFDPIGDALVTTPTAAAGYGAAGVTPAFLDSWGSGFVAGRQPGPAWTSRGPNLPAYTPPLPNVSVGNGNTLNLTAPALAAYAGQVDIDATVLLLNPGAGTAGRISLTRAGDTTVDKRGPYCTMATCACPAGSGRAGTTFAHIDSGQQFVGFTGGNRPGALALVGMSLPDFCGKTVVACIVGQWTSTSVRFEVSARAGTGPIPQSGGAGAKLHIDPKGGFSIVFDGMQPLTATINGMTVDYLYAGSATSVIRLPADDTAAQGAWDFVGPSTHTPITLTIRPHAPDQPALPPINLAAPGSDSAPPVGKTWKCSGDTMVLAIPVESMGQFVWTFTRTGPG